MIPKLLDRFLRLSLPSLSVFNGNAMAGGLFMGLCHDMRTMNSAHGRLCLNELLFGIQLTEPLMAVIRFKLPPSTVFKLHMAKMILP